MRGQKSRSGPGVRPGFEGGQTPMHRRFPKPKGIAGGMGAGKAKYVTVNVDDISAASGTKNVRNVKSNTDECTNPSAKLNAETASPVVTPTATATNKSSELFGSLFLFTSSFFEPICAS